MLLSVIIPTYNRKTFLLEALASLSRQTLPIDQFEVIVVNDGSDQDISEIKNIQFPFKLRYLWQKNQGDAEARNHGASQSKADLLIFIDDDMLVEESYLRSMVEAYEQSKKLVVMGTTYPWIGEKSSESLLSSRVSWSDNTNTNPSFTELCSNNMSVMRRDYFEIGMMENLGFPGSSIWCDVDFAYRAYKAGYDFYRSPRAIGYERDYVAENLYNSSQRGYQMAYRAVVLFQKHPDLIDHIPMFHDKTPLAWGVDGPHLILRKLVRFPASSLIVLTIMEQTVHFLEKHAPSPKILHPIYRWVIGGYIFRGFREGLRVLSHDNYDGVGRMHQNPS